MKHAKKILGILVIALALLASPMIQGAEQDITGTFTPTSSVSAELWNTTMAWGSIGAGANNALETQINNTGDTNIDVTIKYKTTASDLSLVAGVPGEDQYRVEQDGTGGYTDVTVAYTSVTSNLGVSSDHPFNVKVTMGSSFTEDWGQQTHDNTVQYVAHT